jgi:hypothetical protein
MGYLITSISKDYLLFRFTNTELIAWDITAPLDLQSTKNFVVDQCTLVYVNATTALTFASNPELNLIDTTGAGIQYAFNQSISMIQPDSAIRLSGGNKSSGNVLPYDVSNGLLLETTESVTAGDGELLVYLWGTFL